LHDDRKINSIPGAAPLLFVVLVHTDTPPADIAKGISLILYILRVTTEKTVVRTITGKPFCNNIPRPQVIALGFLFSE
jgi:hypothetical protein